jgi:hypothetical protein
VLDRIVKTRKRMILSALAIGFVLQIAIPMLALVGLQRAAIWSILPGFYPILLATRGWFAGISPLGYVLMCSINTIAYGLLVLGVLIAIRACNTRRLSHS